MKRQGLLLIVCVGWLLALGQRPANKLSRYSLDFKISKSNFVDSIAIEWDRGQVYLPVVIGQKSYRFLFDTGSGQTVVFRDTPFEGMQPAGQIASVDAIGRRDTVEMVTMPPMTLGTTTFTGCQATIQKRAVKRRNIDGIIGFDIIAKGLNAKIDVQAGLLILSDRRQHFAGEEGYTVRYKLNFHVPYIRLNPFGKFKEMTLLDTGSRQFYTINRQSFERGMADNESLPGVIIDSKTRGRYAMGHHGLEPQGEVLFLTLDAMKWDDLIFSDVHAATSQGGSHFGAALLKYGALTFNPKKRTVCFQPYQDVTRVSVQNDLMEIAFVSDGGRPAVGLIREDSTPYQQGLRLGDVIIAVDGTPVVSFMQFVGMSFERGRSYRFTVRGSDGTLREVEWVRLPTSDQSPPYNNIGAQ